MGRYVVTQPTFDDATTIGSLFFEKFIAAPARANGKLAGAFTGSDAVQANVYAVMRNETGLIVTGVGHGNEDVFTGDQERTIFETCQTPPEILVGQYVTHLSCSTGKRLGPDLVSKGALVFMGYKDVFWFMINNPADGVNDVYAKDFLEPDMVKEAFGLTDQVPKDAYDAAFTEFELRAVKWDSVNPDVADMIRYDKNILVYVEPTQPPPPPSGECWVCKVLRWLAGVFKCKGFA